MSYAPEHCWYLERVGVKELPSYILQNSKEEIRLGRKRKDNDKVLKNSLQASRNHLIFIRHGNPDNWETIRWSVKDLGGTNGTYINQKRIPANQPMVLNADELIGIGCPDAQSKLLNDTGDATFVYLLKAPKAFNADQDADNDDEDTDQDTPPPSVVEEKKESGDEASSSSQPQHQVVQTADSLKIEKDGRKPNDNEKKEEKDEEEKHIRNKSSQQSAATGLLPSTSISTNDYNEHIKEKTKKRKERKSSGGSEDGRAKKRKRIRRLLSSSDEEEDVKYVESREADFKISSSQTLSLNSILKGIEEKRLEVSLKHLSVPNRAVGAKLKECGITVNRSGMLNVKYEVEQWRKLPSDEYKRISRFWRGLPADGSKGTPLLAELDSGDESLFESDGEVGEVSSKESSSNESGVKSKFQKTKAQKPSIHLKSDSLTGRKKLESTGTSHVKTSLESEAKSKAGNESSAGPSSARRNTIGKAESQTVGSKQPGEPRGGTGVQVGSLNAEYEDISSDEDVNRDLDLVGIDEIRRSMMLCDSSSASSASSSPEIVEIPRNEPDNRNKRKSPDPTTSDNSSVEHKSGTSSLSSVTLQSDKILKPAASSTEVQHTDKPSSKGSSKVNTVFESDSDDMYEPPEPATVPETIKTEEAEDTKPKVKIEGELPCPDFPGYQDDDDEVVIINGSDDEDHYLSMSQSFQAESEDEQENEDDDVICLGPPTDPEQKDAYGSEGESSAVEDSDEEEILNSSQTGLFHKIKNTHKMDIKTVTKIKTESCEEESQSLLSGIEEDDQIDELLINDIVATLEHLGDEEVVKAAYKKDKETGNGKTSCDNIFRLAREEIENREVDRILREVGCNRGIVRECLAEVRQENTELYIERVDLGDLETRVKRSHAKNKIMESLMKKSEFDKDVISVILQEMESKGLEMTEEAVEKEYHLRKKKLEEKNKMISEEKASASADDKQDHDELFEPEDLDLPILESVAGDSDASRPSTRQSCKSDQDNEDDRMSDESIDELLRDMDEDETNTNVDMVDVGAKSDDSKTMEAASSKPQLDDINIQKMKSKIELHRSKSGPILTDALPQPHRRAYNRGISADTVGNLMSKQSLSTAQKSKRSEPIQKYTGPFVKKPPEVDRPKSRAEQKEERKAKLREVAEKERKSEKKTKSSATSQVGIMKSSEPKNKKLLEDLQTTIKPVARKSGQRHNSGDKPRLTAKKDVPQPANVSTRRRSEPENGKPSLPGQLDNQRRKSSSLSTSENETLLDKQSNNFQTSGFLEAEARTDRMAARKEKMERTSEGYVMKKLSEQNMDYNVCSQDISRKPMQRKFLKYSGISSELSYASKKKKKRVTWVDQRGPIALVMIREIEADNKGRKVNNIKDIFERHVKVSKMKEVSTDDIIESMVTWNPMWLKEQKKKGHKNEPPVHGKYNIQPLPAKFESFDDYRRLFIPLMLHEMWSVISRDADEKEEKGAEDILPVMIQEINDVSTERFRTFHCTSLLTEAESRRDPGQDGTFVIVHFSYFLNENNQRVKEIRPSFGHVREIHKKRLGDHKLSESENEVKKQILAKKRNQKEVKYLVNYVIKTKKGLVDNKSRHLCFDKPVIIKFLTRIKPELRKVQALLDLPNSKLFSNIVNPSKSMLKVRPTNGTLHPNIKDLPQFRFLNDCQKRVISGITRTCLEDQESRVSLVQGPPGTGKSSTIIGIILQLISARMSCSETAENAKKDRRLVPRILVCAPSNAAVDTLALKLKDVKESLQESKQFNFIRLGIVKSMHPSVQKYSFDSVVERMVTADTRQIKCFDSMESDERSKQQEANKIYEDKMKAEKDGKTDLAAKLDRQYKEVMKERERTKNSLKQPLEPNLRYKVEQDAIERLMIDVDVILTTLSSSLNQVMDRFFVKGKMNTRKQNFRNISVCIIDEASQCVEPEALIPLKLKFNKLVMVGDHEQLPATVTSRKAKSNDYHKSLFGRLLRLFSVSDSPAFKLNTQYRMHADISNWPNRYFYGGTLHSGNQKRESVLAPYTILNLASKETADRGSISNELECKVAVDVAQCVKNLIPSKSLTTGVITFYSKQKANISLELQNRRVQGVDVNTVDGYQGSERDVIIISCVRSGGDTIGFLSDKERLNVALTRARIALIIIGNTQTLSKKSGMWSELLNNARERKAVYDWSEDLELKTVLASQRDQRKS